MKSTIYLPKMEKSLKQLSVFNSSMNKQFEPLRKNFEGIVIDTQPWLKWNKLAQDYNKVINKLNINFKPIFEQLNEIRFNLNCKLPVKNMKDWPYTPIHRMSICVRCKAEIKDMREGRTYKQETKCSDPDTYDMYR